MNFGDFKSVILFNKIGKYRPHSKHLTIKEKKSILRIFVATLEEKGEQEYKKSEAVRATAKMLGLCMKTIWMFKKYFIILSIL